MEGISKEMLIAELEMSCEPFRRDVINELIEECTELNPWMPIDNPPEEHKRVLILFDNGQCEVARLVNGEWTSNDGLDYDYGFEKPIYWRALPDDPK